MVIVIAKLARLDASGKATKGMSVQKGIRDNIGTFFTDGLPVADKLKTASEFLSSAASKYEQTKSPADKDAMDTAEEIFDVIMNNTILYVQQKCNEDPTNEVEIAHTAALDIKGKAQKKPKPDAADSLEAEFTNTPGTIMLDVNKFPKNTIFFEVFITTTPTDASSWKLITTMAGKKLLIENLISGTRYYIRVVSCNKTGKSSPSNQANQLAA